MVPTHDGIRHDDLVSRRRGNFLNTARTCTSLSVVLKYSSSVKMIDMYPGPGLLYAGRIPLYLLIASFKLGFFSMVCHVIIKTFLTNKEDLALFTFPRVQGLLVSSTA